MSTKIKERHSPLFVLNGELKGIADLIMAKKYTITGPKEAFVSFALGKAHKTHRAILILCQLGYGEDAAILVRSLFDLAITLLYILKDPTDERVSRYFSYDWIIRKRMREYVMTKPSLIKAMEARLVFPKSNDGGVEEVKEQSKAAEDKYGYKNMGWSDKSIKRMAEEVGRIDAYNTVYFLQSNISHSAVRVINEYVKEERGGCIIEVGQSKNWVQEDLVTAFDFFSIIVNKCNEMMNLDFDKQLNDLVKKYVKEVGQINKRETKCDR